MIRSAIELTRIRLLVHIKDFSHLAFAPLCSEAARLDDLVHLLWLSVKHHEYQ